MYRNHQVGIQEWLQRRFPRTCQGLVQDAVADAFTHALVGPETFLRAFAREGSAALLRLIQHVAWRILRGYRRKKGFRSEVSARALMDAPCDLTPETAYVHRESVAVLMGLIDEAAARFGGARAGDLRQALYARLAGGSDTEVARAHQVPREYVNRAKRWIATRLEGA